MENSIVEPGRLQIKIWRMRIARWILQATNTQSVYVILIAFPLSMMVARNRLNVAIFRMIFSSSLVHRLKILLCMDTIK